MGASPFGRRVMINWLWKWRQSYKQVCHLFGSSIVQLDKGTWYVIGKWINMQVPFYYTQVSQAGAYPSFCSMKWLGVFLLPPGWDASPSQGYSPASSLPVPSYKPGGGGGGAEALPELVLCPGTQCKVPRGLKPGCSIWRRVHQPWASYVLLWSFLSIALHIPTAHNFTCD